MTTLSPKVLGFWTRYLREIFHWSQEELAELSKLNVRTIQRIEASKRTSIITRRALARGLGYKNQDVFDDSAFVKQLAEMVDTQQPLMQKEMFEQQFPDQIRVKAERVINGDILGRLIGSSNATAFHADDNISLKAKQVSASLFDYIRDMADLYNAISFSERVVLHNELESLLKELKGLGVAVYSALRTTRVIENQTPMQLTIGYLTIVPVEKETKEMVVPRRIS